MPADTWPYVTAGSDGLRGILLGDVSATSGPTASSCVTGGCHGFHSPTTHPTPSDVPGKPYWP